MNAKLMNWLVSIVFAGIVIGAFYWLWTMSKDFTVQTTVASNLKTVNVEGVKTEANSLIAGRNNSANIPIPVPSEKMGKANPFK